MDLKGACIALMLLMAISGCSEEDSGPTDSVNQYVASATFDFAYPVTAQTGMVLLAVSGSIDIAGSPDLDSVHIEGTRRIISDISLADAESRLGMLQVSALSESDEFSVATNQPQNTEGRQYLIEYQIRMPANLILDVAQVAGTIDIDSLGNSISLENTAGAVDVSDLSGNITASVIAGSLDVSCEVQPGGSVNLFTVTGPISLTIPAGTSAVFQANTVTGTINLQNLVLNDPVIHPDSVSGVLGTGDGSIKLQTTTGNVNVIGIQ